MDREKSGHIYIDCCISMLGMGIVKNLATLITLLILLWHGLHWIGE